MQKGPALASAVSGACGQLKLLLTGKNKSYTVALRRSKRLRVLWESTFGSGEVYLAWVVL